MITWRRAVELSLGRDDEPFRTASVGVALEFRPSRSNFILFHYLYLTVFANVRKIQRSLCIAQEKWGEMYPQILLSL